MCLGVLTVLATTGAAGFIGDADRRQPANSNTDMAVHRGDDFEVTVRSVSDVDSFVGMEPATGLSFRARVAGIRPVADCRPSQSLITAENLLRGKNVWLTVKKDSLSGNDEIAVDVRLPDGADYARTVVHDGVASADISARGELASVEAAARVERRGLWSVACAPEAVTATSSSAPPTSTSTPAPTTTTTTDPPTTTKPSSRPLPPPPEETSTSSPSHDDDDDEWIAARLGKLCFVEGARRTSPGGTELVCTRNGKGLLRWRRAD